MAPTSWDTPICSSDVRSRSHQPWGRLTDFAFEHTGQCMYLPHAHTASRFWDLFSFSAEDAFDSYWCNCYCFTATQTVTVTYSRCHRIHYSTVDDTASWVWNCWHCVNSDGDGGRNSSVGSAWARCQSVAGSILLWGHFPEEGIFPLELTWVQTPFSQNSFG